MKYILKRNEPQSFTDLKLRANVGWEPAYNTLSGDVKKAVKDSLIAEQGHICCYCECRITSNNSHIEHVCPQSEPKVDPLDYSNLACSCQTQLQKGEPRHCGHLKEDWFDADLLVSPFDPGCGERFTFEGNGRIKPASDLDEAASKTIKKLGLDISKLKALRAKVIEPFLDEGLSYKELEKFVSGYLSKDASGRFGEFWTTIHYLFGNHVIA